MRGANSDHLELESALFDDGVGQQPVGQLRRRRTRRPLVGGVDLEAEGPPRPHVRPPRRTPRRAAPARSSPPPGRRSRGAAAPRRAPGTSWRRTVPVAQRTTGYALVRRDVALGQGVRHGGRERGRGRRAVPGLCRQPVAQRLLVEGGGRAPGHDLRRPASSATSRACTPRRTGTGRRRRSPARIWCRPGRNRRRRRGRPPAGRARGRCPGPRWPPRAPTRSTAAAKSMLTSWPSAALVEGVKMGSASRLASCRPGGMAVPCTVPDRSYSS